VNASTPRQAYHVLRGFRYVLGRGTVSTGYYVSDDSGRVVSGPYTDEGQACDKADALDAELAATIARGLDELSARRVASALGVELGPFTCSELAATAELERTADELGLEVPA